MENMSGYIVLIAAILVAALFVKMGVKMVPQSQEYVVERLGKYDQTLKPGFNFILPVINRVAHKVDILERQLPQEKMPVITKDSVQFKLDLTVFFRVTDAAKSVYRINNLDAAIRNTVTATVRSICGQLGFDDIQGHRDQINLNIKSSLTSECEVWGVEVTRAEILDVQVDADTSEALSKQRAAEMTKRASVLQQEGLKRSQELKAEADLYTAQKEAEAIRTRAEAQAFEQRTLAEAQAYATTTISAAISGNGQSAIDFEIAKLQCSSWTEISKSPGSKLIIIPTEVSRSLGSLASMLESFQQMKSPGA